MLVTKLVLDLRSLASSHHIPGALLGGDTELKAVCDPRPFLLVDGLWVWGWGCWAVRGGKSRTSVS